MFQIAAVGLIGVLLSMAVKSYRPEFSIYISIVCGLILFMMMISQLEEIMVYIKDICSYAGNGKSYFGVLLKVLAVAYITDFVIQICKDSGENSIGSKVEIAGKVCILYISLPVFTSVLSMIKLLLSNWG